MKFSSEIPVELIDSRAFDADVVQAARVSTQGAAAEPEEAEGLIRYLIRNRHMTPFEHTYFKFRVTAPIFVWREHHRHRIGFSYNEESGRYKQLEPNFYLAEKARTQQGKPGHYVYVDGDEGQTERMRKRHMDRAHYVYEGYLEDLADGVAREQAREQLGVNIFSTCFVTCNARSLMSFLSLRTKDEESTFPSFPAHEIEMMARQYEATFEAHMPITYKAFCDFGRVGG